jgi:hypothetical protein
MKGMREYQVTSGELYRTYHRLPFRYAIINSFAGCYIGSFRFDVLVEVEEEIGNFRIVKQKEEEYVK